MGIDFRPVMIIFGYCKYPKILLPSLFDYFPQVEEAHGTAIEYAISQMLKCYNVDK
jgi:hypothetical protein